jgi:hypothetical protein
MSFYLVSVQFRNYAVLCHTTIFDSDCIVLSKNFIQEVVKIMVVMADDCPILCGPCTNINILLYSGNKSNVITCHLFFVLNCRWSHSPCDRVLVWTISVCKVCCVKKMVLKFGMIYTKSTILCKTTLRLVKKNKVWFNSSVTKRGNFCTAPSIFCCFSLNIPLFGWLFYICLPNLIKFQLPYISMFLSAENLILIIFRIQAIPFLVNGLSWDMKQLLQQANLWVVYCRLALSLILYR